MRTLALAALGGLVACRLPEPAPAEAGLVTWRLVEIEATGGRRLVLEQEEIAVVATSEGLEVRLSCERAGGGERVEVEAWRPCAAGRCWIEARPSRPGVRLLGPSRALVEGAERARFAFTCDTAGRGGIVVVARE